MSEPGRRKFRWGNLASDYHPRTVFVTARDLRIIELRTAGHDAVEIGKMLKLAPALVNARIKTVLEKYREKLGEDAPVVRQLELGRLDDLFQIAFDRARNGAEGQLAAIDRCLAIMKQRIAYVPDLEVPKVVNIETTVRQTCEALGYAPEQIEEIVEQARRKAEIANAEDEIAQRRLV